MSSCVATTENTTASIALTARLFAHLQQNCLETETPVNARPQHVFRWLKCTSAWDQGQYFSFTTALPRRHSSGGSKVEVRASEARKHWGNF